MVARLVWDQDAAGSTPVTSTKILQPLVNITFSNGYFYVSTNFTQFYLKLVLPFPLLWDINVSMCSKSFQF